MRISSEKHLHFRNSKYRCTKAEPNWHVGKTDGKEATMAGEEGWGEGQGRGACWGQQGEWEYVRPLHLAVRGGGQEGTDFPCEGGSLFLDKYNL